MSNRFKIVSIFNSEDDFGGDPWEYDVYFDGKKVTSFGDDYHDKGHAKARGFIEGYCKASGIKYDEREVEYGEVADPNRF